MVRVTVVRGNAGEVATIVGVEAEVRGVDSVGVSADPAELALQAARTLGLVVSSVPVAWLPPGSVPEINTSTRCPGTTNPARPTISSTLTATARDPGGMVAAKPAPAPLGAKRSSTMG